jgi:hypothetical protein
MVLRAIHRLVSIKLCGTDYKTQPGCPAPHTRVQRDKATSEQACQRDVVRVVGLSPAQLVRDTPTFPRKPIQFAATHRGREHPVAHRLGLLAAQLPPPEHCVQSRDGFDPHQRWRDQLKPSKPLKPERVRGGRDGDARVNDQLHRPSRERATAATQFGAGVPSSSCSHSGGSGSIGYISSRTSSRSAGSIRRLPRAVSACKRPSRIHRRTVPGLLPTR